MKKEARIQELEKQLQERDQLIEELQASIQKLEGMLAKNSSNSSKPPSSDGFKRRNYSKRKPSTRHTGGQPGHEGQTLLRSEVPDEILIHRPEVCQDCHAALQNIPGEISETRQVMDIPPTRQNHGD